jgi:hypothetical protein
MPFHLSTLDKPNVVWRHIQAKLFARGEFVREASLERRLQARYAERTVARVEPMRSYTAWQQAFAQKPAWVNQDAWNA